MAKEKINFEDEQVRLCLSDIPTSHIHGAGRQEPVAGCQAGDRTSDR